MTTRSPSIRVRLFAAGVPVGRAPAGEAPLSAGLVVVTDLLDAARPTVVDLFPALSEPGRRDGRRRLRVRPRRRHGHRARRPARSRPVPARLGRPGAGELAGIEYPDQVVRLVDLGEAEVDPAAAARVIAEELAATEYLPRWAAATARS